MASQFQMAAGLIVIAAFLDGLDGHLARKLNATSAFGAQLDSLADFINFGVAPAFVLYLWKQHLVSAVGWAVAIFFIVCAAIRLARFNAHLDDEEEERKILKALFFTGVPAPAGAIIVLSPLMITFSLAEHLPEYLWNPSPYAIMIYSTVAALLMASRMPTYSFKRFKIPKQYGTVITATFGLLAIALITEPWVTVPFLTICYVLTLPFSVRHYYHLKGKNITD